MKIFINIKKIPVAGTLIKITNAYVYNNDDSANDRFAPFHLWIKKFAIKTIITLLFLLYIFFDQIKLDHYYLPKLIGEIPETLSKPGSIIYTIMPSLLGFGIGVYALLFAINGNLLRRLHDLLVSKKNENKTFNGSFLMLNSDLAFPLTFILITLFLGVLQIASPNSLGLIFISWFFLIYSFIALLEIIGVIYSLVDVIMTDKFKEKNQE